MRDLAATQHWNRVSQSLHWLIAFLILCMGIVGLIMVKLPPKPSIFWVYTAHKSLGIAILISVCIRVIVRLSTSAPPPLAALGAWQHRIAHVTHFALYGMMFAMPLTGWLLDSASGLRPFRWFGLFPMPKLVAPDAALSHQMHRLHEWGFWLLILLVIIHSGAALFHHFIQHDATLIRMLPRRRRSPVS